MSAKRTRHLQKRKKRMGARHRRKIRSNQTLTYIKRIIAEIGREFQSVQEQLTRHMLLYQVMAEVTGKTEEIKQELKKRIEAEQAKHDAKSDSSKGYEEAGMVTKFTKVDHETGTIEIDTVPGSNPQSTGPGTDAAPIAREETLPEGTPEGNDKGPVPGTPGDVG